MSVLEIILMVFLGGVVIWYLAKGIYDLKHPEKVKAKKDLKKLKKQEKHKGREKNGTEEENEEDY